MRKWVRNVQWQSHETKERILRQRRCLEKKTQKSVVVESGQVWIDKNGIHATMSLYEKKDVNAKRGCREKQDTVSLTSLRVGFRKKKEKKKKKNRMKRKIKTTAREPSRFAAWRRVDVERMAPLPLTKSTHYRSKNRFCYVGRRFRSSQPPPPFHEADFVSAHPPNSFFFVFAQKELNMEMKRQQKESRSHRRGIRDFKRNR